MPDVIGVVKEVYELGSVTSKATQNFKYVSWAAVCRALHLN